MGPWLQGIFPSCIVVEHRLEDAQVVEHRLEDAQMAKDKW
jgi:hypothetical protein